MFPGRLLCIDHVTDTDLGDPPLSLGVKQGPPSVLGREEGPRAGRGPLVCAVVGQGSSRWGLQRKAGGERTTPSTPQPEVGARLSTPHPLAATYPGPQMKTSLSWDPVLHSPQNAQSGTQL